VVTNVLAYLGASVLRLSKRYEKIVVFIKCKDINKGVNIPIIPVRYGAVYVYPSCQLGME
jgi:hypothetical protein